MAPKIRDEVLQYADQCDLVQEAVTEPVSDPTKLPPRCKQLVWRNVILFILLHVGSLYGVYCIFYANYYTWFWGKLIIIIPSITIKTAILGDNLQSKAVNHILLLITKYYIFQR
jgi:hypothetical protein